MNVIFMRHGEAGPYVPDDKGRKLTECGIKQAQDSARYMANVYRPDLLITSPYDRARETADQVLLHYERLGVAIPTVVCEAITPDDDPEHGLNRLYKLQQAHGCVDTVLVVCHMPIVARMEALMTASYYGVPFELAEFRVLSAPHFAQGLGTRLTSYVPMIDS